MAQYIRSKDNQRIKHAIKLSKDAGTRRRENRFFVSSSKAVSDLMARGFTASEVFATHDGLGKLDARALEGRLFEIAEPVADKLSDSKTDDGVWAVFEMPERDRDPDMTCDRILVLVDVQDPNNVGAVMRTAMALGYTQVLLSEGCADVYSPKVIRTSMTASVRLATHRISEIYRMTGRLEEEGYTTVATCLRDSEELGKWRPEGKVAIYIGNEGNGLDDELIDMCRVRLKIPMKGDIDSLNAGVSRRIVMWELRS
ncbi:MAG: RNA methyltransferase [Oscillospiraceae bacterium]|nr:RNA methyltransferase [Oscillospiraceae bacterium]